MTALPERVLKDTAGQAQPGPSSDDVAEGTQQEAWRNGRSLPEPQGRGTQGGNGLHLVQS